MSKKKNKKTKTISATKLTIEQLRDSVNKTMDTEAVALLDSTQVYKGEVIPTGVPSIDAITGIGGFPRGRIVEVYGPESSGKTTLCLCVAAAAQKMGLIVAFVDAEHALDVEWARTLGVDPDKLLVSQPDYGEQALDVCDALIRTSSVGLVIVDSVAALTPKAELDGDMEDQQPGLQARMMNKALRKLTAAANTTDTCLVFINQIRQKIGVLWGSNETTPGGNGLKFYASMRLTIRYIGAIMEAVNGDKTRVGSRVRVRCIKNKLAAPYKETELDVRFGIGFDVLGDLLDRSLATGAVTKRGAWYYLGDQRLGQGRARVLESLRDDDDLVDMIRGALT